MYSFKCSVPACLREFASAPESVSEFDLRCPNCRALETIELRRFECVRVYVDLRPADLHGALAGKSESGAPVRRKLLRHPNAKGREPSMTLFDYRPAVERGAGSLARIRVMRRAPNDENGDGSGEYLVLESVAGGASLPEPTAALVAVGIHYFRSAESGVLSDRSRWSAELPWASATRKRSGMLVVAIVDDDHPLLTHREQSIWRSGLRGEELHVSAFRPPFFVRPIIRFEALTPARAKQFGAAGFQTVADDRGLFVRIRSAIPGDSFDLGNDFDDGELWLEGLEAGGAHTDAGWAVVCGALSGNPLRAFATEENPVPCGNHGYFGSPQGLAVVQAIWNNKAPDAVSIELTTHAPLRTIDTASFVSRSLYVGAPEQLTAELAYFTPMVTAAVIKVRDYRSTKMYFRLSRTFPGG